MIEAIIFDWVGTLYIFGGKGLFPYSEGVLRRLHKKYKLAVISKATSDNVETRMKQIHSIKKYFEVIIVDVDKTPEQYTECMQRLSVKPKNTLVVGDRTLREIQIGNKLGCQTYWIRNGRYAHEVPTKETGKPTKIINSVEDLLTIL